MGWAQGLAVRLEKALSFHFHVHWAFNIQEFIRPLEEDVTASFKNLSPADFMAEPDVCDECGIALDLRDPGTIGVEWSTEDGSTITVYYHESCAAPEHRAEADAEEDGED